jgi:multiple sugar transport system substrate-binding protein/sn-glycerol 3-phosphate transport system substrate-binding protein
MNKKYPLLPLIATLCLIIIALTGCRTSQETTDDRENHQTHTIEALKSTNTPQPASTPDIVPTATLQDTDLVNFMSIYDGIDPANQRITLWHSLTDVRDTALLEIIEDFNTSNEWGISVVAEYQGDSDELQEKIMAIESVQDTPNLLVSNANPAGIFNLRDTLININLLIGHEKWGLEPGDQADIFPGFLEQGVFPSYGGARLGWPLFGSMNVLYYNTDWLTELGFANPPESPESFQQAACAAMDQPFSGATANGRLGYGIIPSPSSFVDWTISFGGKLYDIGSKQYSFDNSANSAAMTYLQDLVNNGCATIAASPQDVLVEFSRGVLLFSVDSIDNIPAYRSNIQKEANFNWRIAPIPHTTSNPAANILAFTAGITRTTAEEQLAAWLFLKYFTRPDIQAKWVQITNTLSIRTDTAVFLEDYFSSSPAYQMTFEILRHSVNEPMVPRYDQVRGKYQMVLQAVLEGGNVTDILAELTTEANRILEEQLVFLPESQDPWGETDPNGQTIKFWHQHGGDRQAVVEEIINEFNITNVWGITVIPEKQGSYGDIFTNLVPLLGTEEVPNLVVAYQHHAATYHLAGGLIDLTSLIESPKWGIDSKTKEDFFPGIFAQDVFSIFDGTRLGYPIQRSTDVLYFNAEWLAELGFDSSPATPDEFKQMACAATEPFSESTIENGLGYQFYLDATRFSSWVFAFGGDLFDEDTNKFTYDNDLSTNTVNYLLDLIENGCATAVVDRDEAQTAFGEGATLFMVDSSIHIPTIEKMVKDMADFEWSIAPIPSFNEIPFQNVFGASLSIPASTPEAELAAWLFMKYFTSPEVQARWSQGSHYMPVRISANDHLGTYFSGHSKNQRAFEFLSYGVTEPSVPGYDFVRQEVELALEAILEDGDVEAILTSLNETANQVLIVHMER